MTVRAAVETDRLRVLRLARNFHSAGSFDFPFDAARLNRLIGHCIAADDATCLLVGEPIGGFLLARCLDSDIGPIRFAEEIMIWVEPQARGTCWRELVTAFEAWARNRGCASAKMSAQVHMRPEAMQRLLRRVGYKPLEAVFSRVL